jgi:hypothetical protein
MKIIFCDIDGVLNSEKSFERRSKLVKERLLDSNRLDWPTLPMVDYFNYIIESTGTKIVISSSWRHYHPLFEDNKEDTSKKFKISIANIFKEQGVLGEIIDKTPTVKLSGNRGLEIKAWLDDHPEVTKFVIIDDNSDMQPLMDYLVQTTWENGLTLENARQAIKMLKGDNNE